VSHSHGHTHGTGAAAASAGNRFRGRLAIAFALTAAFFLVELVAGVLSGSLAVVADAGHMATDVVALGASLVATRVATRPDGTGRRTYGSYRAEVFAAGLATLLMVGVGVFVVVEAINRIGEPAHVTSTVMIVVGIAGLLVNGICALLLRNGSTQSLNVRGAYLEVLGDAAGSAGVLLAGALIAWTGNPVWDIVAACAIGLFVLIRALGLGRSVLRVLGQHAPEGIDPAAVETDLAAVDGVHEVHDLHLWTLTSGMHVATAHLVCRDGADPTQVLTDAAAVLRERFAIDHATIQVEPSSARACVETSW
jgi:cobalt-zinc-cadmium efflux system protein